MALLTAAAIVGADLLGGMPFTPSAPGGGAGDLRGADGFSFGDDPNGSRALAAELLAGLPFGAGDAARTPASPGDLTALTLPAGVARLPIPEAPAGPQPLRQALEVYAQRYGSGGIDLASATPLLGLDPDAESALARLVLAFVEASRLQGEAISGLSEEEKAMFSGLPDATLAWNQAHPEATLDDLDAHLRSLAQEKVDSAKMAQAGDLLTRAVDLVRVPLSKPPVLLVGPQPAAAEQLVQTLDDPWSLMRAAVGISGVQPAQVTPPASLDAAVRDLAAAYGLAPAQILSLPALLHPTLEHAIALIVAAQAAGVRSGDAAAHASALLAAVEEATPTLRAWSAILATGSASGAPAETNLDAFLSAALAPVPAPVSMLAASRGQEFPTAATPRPLPEILALYGIPLAEATQGAAALPPQAAAALALILEADLGLTQANNDLVAGLDDVGRAALLLTPALVGLSHQEVWTPEEAVLVEAWAHALNSLDGERLDALQDAQMAAAAAAAAAAALLQTPMATEDRRADLPDPVGGLAPEDPASPATDALGGACRPIDQPSITSDCANDVYFQTGNFGGILVTGPGSTTIDPSFAGGNPRIIIDLGGNDLYRVAAGGATNGFGIPGDAAKELPIDQLIRQFFITIYGPNHQSLPTTLGNALSFRYYAVALDAGGDDRYLSSADVGQGAASGLGTVGILWDRDGDDRYEQDAGGGEALRFFQGMAGAGGLALLVDEGGADRYLAPHGLAQGVGLSPALPVGFNGCPDGFVISFCQDGKRNNAVAGTGLLADLGPGADRFQALGGQGHGGGYATVGVLFDEAGETAYRVTPPSLEHQGGRGATAYGASQYPGGGSTPIYGPGQVQRTGGLAALIDLGGAGDSYTAPRFQAAAASADGAVSAQGGWLVLRHPSQELRKGDDALWLNNTAGLAIGLDSSLGDRDGDGYADLIELLAQSNPGDPAQSPQHTVVEANRKLVEQAVAGIVDTVTRLDLADSDGDGYPNSVEDSLGSNATDPGSTPNRGVPTDPGFLLTLPVLCSTEDDDDCRNGPCDTTIDVCVSLLSIGGPGRTTHARPAIVELDLEGDDLYTTVVAGEGAWTASDGVTLAAGSLSIDVDGDDSYDTPNLARTQAFASSGVSQVDTPYSGASLLLDLNGTDVYRAGEQSQAASVDAIAVLADFAGDDSYEGKAGSQASHWGSRAGVRGAALLDLGGDDRYLFATQASLRGALGGPLDALPNPAVQPTVDGAVATAERAPLAALSMAVLLDAAGADRYESTIASTTGFETQGTIEDATKNGVSELSRALFMDLGDAADAYYGLIAGEGWTNLTAIKDGATLHANPAPAGAAVFSDGLTGDDDKDGVPGFAEALAGSDPKDDQDRPVGADGLPVHVSPPDGVTGFRLPGLIIGGQGPDVYTKREDFIVDLGGDDQYLAAGIGGTTSALHAHPGQPASATLLFDVGGNDVYRPEPYRVSRTYPTQTLQTVDPPLVVAGTGGATTAPTLVLALPRTTDYGSVSAGATQIPLQILFQPSLGAASLGVAVLADQGGRNTFNASTDIDISADARLANGQDGNAIVNVRAWGLNMGASLYVGVGALVTWDASNSFQSEITVKAQEGRSTFADPLADAFALTQGASYGTGSGILVALGSGDDVYEAFAKARAPGQVGDGGRERAYAQGATAGAVGILFDDGGSNRFTASAGFAQGAASMTGPLASVSQFATQHPVRSLPVGLLWSGPGDDQYEGGLASQGASSHESSLADTTALGANAPAPNVAGDDEVGRPALGALVDSGGNDQYRLAPPLPTSRLWSTFFCPRNPGSPSAPGQAVFAGSGNSTCALSQGAAELGGLGLLVDWAGDDLYEAVGRTHVQGAGLRGGVGSLIDMSGNDVYKAASNAQGYAAARGGTATGLLVDLEGRDAYILGSRGQGYADGQFSLPVKGGVACTFLINTCPQLGPVVLRFPFNEPALFVDLGGDDAYRYGGTKDRPTFTAAEPKPADGNNWVWSERPPGVATVAATAAPPTPVATGLPRGLGIDSQGLDEAVASYNSIGVADGVGSVSLCVSPKPGDCIQPELSDRLAERVTLVANVDAGTGFVVRRVTILRDGAAMASLAGTQGNDGAYEFVWDTPSSSPDGVLDGQYNITATAFFAPVQQGQTAGAAAPDAVSVASDTMALTIDNGPTGSAALAFPILPTGRRVAGVSPDVSNTRADLRIVVGRGLEHRAGHPGSGVPGAFVNVSLAPSVGNPIVLQDRYEENGTLRIDIDGHCGAVRPSPCPDGPYELRVRLTDVGGKSLNLPAMPLFIDGTPPTSNVTMPERANKMQRIGASGLAVAWSAEDNLAGVDQVTTIRLASDGTPAANPPSSPAGGGLAVHGNTTLQGIESNSTIELQTVARDTLGNEEVLDPLNMTQVIIDFAAPSILDLTASPAIARPNVPVLLAARVNDPEGALSGVTVSIGGARDLATASMIASGPLYVKQVIFTNSTIPGGEETPYIFTVEATDAAGNPNLERAAAMLDSKRPQPSLLKPAEYRDGTQEVPKGRPGAIAQFDLLVTDFKVDSGGVRINATSLGLGTLGCTDQGSGRRWLCLVAIPETKNGAPLLDGDYDLPLIVTDAAGNVNDTMTLVAEVDSQPPKILDARISASGPDFIEVSWNTTKPTLASVLYGKSTPPQRSFTATDEFSDRHVVRIPGLDPASKYYLRPVAISESNAVNDTAAILTNQTASAFEVALPGFPAHPDWAEARNVTVSVTILLPGTDLVSVSLKVQDAQRKSSPLPVASRSVGGGVHTFRVDTVALPDGEYLLIAEGSRQADVRRVESPRFTIDNTPPVAVPVLPRPGGVAMGSQPDLVLAVIDPLRSDLPSPSTVRLIVDGVQVAAQASYSGSIAGQARLVMPLPTALADGEHRVQLSLADSAENLGEAEWTFRVDSRAPTLGEQRVTYAPDAERGRPGGPANVWLSAADLSGVSALAIDLRAWQGPLTPLFANVNRSWSGSFTIPLAADDGLLDIPVFGIDANGQEGVAGALLLDIDATPPTIVPSVLRLANPTTLDVNATTNEASVLEATAGGRTARSSAGTTHALRLDGLTPGKTYAVTLVAHDLAGNVANYTTSIRMPADGEPPGAPTSVRAVQRDDGVAVTWEPASDNAGVAVYRVTRVWDGQEQTSEVAAAAMRFLDLHAPPGAITYRVGAIDVAGLEGPEATASLTVLAPAVLSDGGFSQRSGPADKPFTVTVRYSHPGGQRPDALTLHHGNLTFALKPVSGGQDCRTGCLYTATVHLPALFTVDDRPETYLEAVTAGQSTLLPVQAPLVTATGLGFHGGAPKDAPGLPIILFLVALLAAVATRRGGRR